MGCATATLPHVSGAARRASSTSSDASTPSSGSTAIATAASCSRGSRSPIRRTGPGPVPALADPGSDDARAIGRGTPGTRAGEGADLLRELLRAVLRDEGAGVSDQLET